MDGQLWLGAGSWSTRRHNTHNTCQLELKKTTPLTGSHCWPPPNWIHYPIPKVGSNIPTSPWLRPTRQAPTAKSILVWFPVREAIMQSARLVNKTIPWDQREKDDNNRTTKRNHSQWVAAKPVCLLPGKRSRLSYITQFPVEGKFKFKSNQGVNSRRKNPPTVNMKLTIIMVFPTRARRRDKYRNFTSLKIFTIKKAHKHNSVLKLDIHSNERTSWCYDILNTQKTQLTQLP